MCALLALSMALPGAGYSEMDGFVPPGHRAGAAELSVYKVQDTYIEEIGCAATKRQGLPFDTFGTSVERQTIE